MTDHLNLTDAPVRIVPFPVTPEWIDYNGHMNVAYYVLAFDKALDQVLDALGVGEMRVKSHKCGPFTLEAHVHYLQEVTEGNPLSMTFHLLDFAPNKMHYFMEMHHADRHYLAATMEQVSLYVDLNERRSTPYPTESLALIEAMAEAHAMLDHPPQVGSVMGLKRR